MNFLKFVLVLKLVLLFNLFVYATTHQEITNNTSIPDNQSYKNYSQAGEGGVFYITQQGTLNLGSNINFSSNTATCGGAIYNNGILNIKNNGYYYNNSAQQAGGALLNFDSAIMNVGYNSYFENNSTITGEGGAIENCGTLTISSGTKFVLNDAKRGGAISNAMYVRGTFFAITNIGDKVEFSSNTATDLGGAISNISAELIIGNNNVFEYNSSSNNGGAIYNSKNNEKEEVGVISIGDNTIFNSNSASYGGAIYNNGILNIKDNGKFYNNSSQVGGALLNFDIGIMNIGYNSYFENNSAIIEEGGAIENCGTLTISSGTKFVLNDANTNGGAISNAMYIKGDFFATTNIGDKVEFSSNTAKNGGAISNISAELIIGNNNVFEYNSSSNNGGAIYNTKNNDILETIISTITIGNNATFEGNTATGIGGAIYNKENLIIGSDVLFKNNIAQTDCGGAIANMGIINIGENVVFSSNSSQGCGGAIYNNANGKINIGTNAEFSNNIEKEHGGAIYTEGIVTVEDGGSFINNTAEGMGGAIYLWNGGIVNLIANTSNIEFSSNTANAISNAIHDNGGTINLWASDSADIIFNDRITSGDNTSILNINQSTTTLTANGKVILNEDMSGYTGTTNIYGGEVELQSKTNGNNINTNKFFSGNINFSSGTINLQNNAIDNITVSNWNSTANSNLKFDTYLSNNTSDNFTVTNSASGDLNLTAINILGVDKNTGTITLFSNKSPNLNILTTASYGGYEYLFSTTTTKGLLTYQKGEEANLKKAINKTTPAIRSYSLANNELVTEDLGQLGGEQLTIFGNGYEVDGNGKAGITVSEGQTLNIDKGTGENFVWKNFNSKNHGGVIYNHGVDNIDTKGIVNIDNNLKFESNNVYTTDNYNSAFGGALYNYHGEMNIRNNVIFSSNSSVSQDINLGADVYGGAIGNEDNSNLTIGENVKFEYNFVKGEYSKGGAIYNGSSKMTILSNALFNSNYAISNHSSHGGAIKNSSGFLTILDGAKFINNKSIELEAKGDGGAIYNGYNAILNLIANTYDVEFTSNTANGISNAIHDNGGTINLYASDTNSIIFNDRITSENNTSILNINQSTTTLNAIGKVILNEDMSGYIGQVNLYNGTIQLGQKGTWFAGNTYVDNATIDMANTIIQEHNFKNLTINNSLNMFVDADLENEQMDTISAESFSGNGKINIKAINILTDAAEDKTEILFTSSTVLKDKITSINTASSDLYKYDVNYNNGYFSFNKESNPIVNPIIAESQIASAVGGTITQAVVLNQAFTSVDNIRNRIIEAKNKGLLYASTSDLLFEQPNRIESGLWIRPYAMQDNLKLNDMTIDNTAVGTLAGLDLSVGENSLLSLYIGYAGSNQKYEEIKINQTGYVLGATGMIIKEDYYLGLTANVNFNKASAENDYGTDDFDMNMYSIGAKAGYNIDLGKKWILEPNLTLMYGNINAQEYQTKQGAKIDSQNTNNILIEPQVKAKLDLTDGWTPYALVGYMLNSGDKTKLVANNVSFEDMQISGYAEYGLGVSKSFKNSAWSCFAQITGKSGERNGFEGNLGIKYSFLSVSEKKDIKLAKYIHKKEKIKQEKKQKEQEEKMLEMEIQTKMEEEKQQELDKEILQIADENKLEETKNRNINKIVAPKIISIAETKQLGSKKIKTIKMVKKPTFTLGKTTLTQQGKKALKQVADELANYKDVILLVEGHTGGTGDKKANMKLSEERALTVAQTLQNDYKVTNEILVVGKGGTEPIASNATSEGKSKNRRVKFIILSK